MPRLVLDKRYVQDVAALAEAIERGTKRSYVIGVDLGQTTDPSAIVILETIDRPELAFADGVMLDPKRIVQFRVRHIERLPLRTPYPAIVARVEVLKNTAPLRDAVVAIDHTGVGRPVFDLFRPRVRPLIGVTITAGREPTRTADGWHVPKTHLLSAVQARLATSTLKIAAGLKEAKALAAELADFRVQVSGSGNMQMNARQGAHDDMLLALAIALFAAEHGVGKGMTKLPFKKTGFR